MVSDDLIKKYLFESIMKNATWMTKLSKTDAPDIITIQGVKHILEKVAQLCHLLHPNVATEITKVINKEALEDGLKKLNENREDWQTKYVKFWIDDAPATTIGNMTDFVTDEQFVRIIKHYRQVALESEQRAVSADILDKLKIPYVDNTEEETERLAKELNEYIDEKFGDEQK